VKLPQTNKGNCVFYREGSDDGFERTLEVLADGSLSHSESPNRYAHLGGASFRSEELSAAAAKKRWPELSADIDAAISRTIKG